MINYSVNPRKNPRDKEAAPKFYATAQKSQNINLDDIANAISVGTTVTRADVWAVIIAMMEQFMKELKNGNSVTLGELGTFRITIKSKGAETAEDFSTSLIKASSVRYFPSRKIKNLNNELSFNKVPSRKTVALAMNGKLQDEEEEGGEDLTA